MPFTITTTNLRTLPWCTQRNNMGREKGESVWRRRFQCREDYPVEIQMLFLPPGRQSRERRCFHRGASEKRTTKSRRTQCRSQQYRVPHGSLLLRRSRPLGTCCVGVETCSRKMYLENWTSAARVTILVAIALSEVSANQNRKSISQGSCHVVVWPIAAQRNFHRNSAVSSVNRHAWFIARKLPLQLIQLFIWNKRQVRGIMRN